MQSNEFFHNLFVMTNQLEVTIIDVNLALCYFSTFYK